MNQTEEKDRPPYVQWIVRPVEDRNASIAAGAYVAKDVDFAIIMRPGSKDTVEKEARVWLNEIKAKARENTIPATWPAAFEASYKMWKDGEELPVNGTPIKLWPALSPAQVQMITRAGILTVEDLAQLPDSEVGVIGIGGLGLKQKAQSWLQSKNSLAEENAALKTRTSELETQVAAMMAEIQAMKAAKK